jgi:hypothetical protein
MEEKARSSLQNSVVIERARPLVLKLTCIQMSTRTRPAKEDTYPTYIDGELLVEDTYKRLCIGFVLDMGKILL